jgi:hypothetical protein
MLNKEVTMTEKSFLKAEDVAEELGVSTAYAYKLIRELNSDLKKRGFITIGGRVSKQYFREKLYGEKAGSGNGERNVSV